MGNVIRTIIGFVIIALVVVIGLNSEVASKERATSALYASDNLYNPDKN